MELGVYSFAERVRDPHTGQQLSPQRRLQEVLEEIELADRVGLDVYGLGEHHRAEFAAASPAVVLAAAASRTKRIRLSSAVTVLSSADPVRVFQDFATLDLISGGRAEIMAGRGAFTESFPLFGYDVQDYEPLFEEKIDLLMQLVTQERVTWQGRFRAPLQDQPVHPRPLQPRLPVWIWVGGSPASAVRAGRLGLPLAIGIVAGDVRRFAPLAELYRQAWAASGHDPAQARISVNAHGFVANDGVDAVERTYDYTMAAMQQFLGLPTVQLPSREQYAAELALPGALIAGSPEDVAAKIRFLQDTFGIDRFLLQISVGTMPHDQVMRSIERFGTEVAPLVRS